MRNTNFSHIKQWLINRKPPDNQSIYPILFSLQKEKERFEFEKFISDNHFITVHDELKSQVRELLKIRNPNRKYTDHELDTLFSEWSKDKDLPAYGIWVYYPWSNKLVHLLDETEFIELRTSRNKYKITQAEQDELAEKAVGVIGLSVGQSVAVNMAIERSFGTMRIADFDTLELTNLNRIRRGVDTIGLKKTTIVAREIAEIDPFLRVEVFDEGITEGNLDEFLTENGKLDLLIEECDSLEIKIRARLRARELKIPVLMDTSDRGMIDIERFDLEPDRELFHGLIEPEWDKIMSSNGVDRLMALYKLAGGADISPRLKASYLELEQSLTTWPQLASSVALGGAAVGDIARKILLNQKVPSGRFYIDLDQLIPLRTDKAYVPEEVKALSREDVRSMIEAADIDKLSSVKIPAEEMDKIIEAGCAAPSSGNDQPWLFVCHNHDILVFHELQRTYSFGDYENIGSLQSIGSAIENIAQQAAAMGYEITVKYYPGPVKNEKFIAQIGFSKVIISDPWLNLSAYIPERITDRTICERKNIDSTLLDDLKRAAESFPGYELSYIEAEEKRDKIGEILAVCDRIRLFHPQGHYDFFHREMRWSEEDAREKRVGMNIHELEIEDKMIPALKMLSNFEVVRILDNVDGGKGFERVSKDAAEKASVFGLLSAKSSNDKAFLEGGRSWERLWLLSTRHKISLHPLIAPVYLFSRIQSGEELTNQTREKLQFLQQELYKVFNLPEDRKPIFLFRLFIGNKTPMKSYRLPKEKVYYDFC